MALAKRERPDLVLLDWVLPGLSGLEVAEALRVFATAPQLAGLVVTEFNPDRDRDGAYAAALVDTLAEAIGGPLSAVSATENWRR